MTKQPNDGNINIDEKQRSNLQSSMFYLQMEFLSGRGKKQGD
jgi:hypothetical protein